MKTIIDFYPERISPPRIGSYSFRIEGDVTLTLKKGRNIFELSLVDQFRTHPDFAELVKTSAIIVVSAEPEAIKAKSINDFKNVNDAKKTIEETFDKLQLETWLAQEIQGDNRTAVITAIKKSIDRLDGSKLQTATID
jgi:hypothetical protein